MRSKKGFTLIELLVVIAIIGILATLAVVSFGSAQDKARDAQRQSAVRSAVAAFNAASAEDADYAICGGSGCRDEITRDTRLSEVRICDQACGSGGQILSNYVDFSKLKDPKGTEVCANDSKIECDYTVQAESVINDFTILYFLKKVGFSAATELGL